MKYLVLLIPFGGYREFDSLGAAAEFAEQQGVCVACRIGFASTFFTLFDLPSLNKETLDRYVSLVHIACAPQHVVTVQTNELDALDAEFDLTGGGFRPGESDFDYPTLSVPKALR